MKVKIFTILIITGSIIAYINLADKKEERVPETIRTLSPSANVVDISSENDELKNSPSPVKKEIKIETHASSNKGYSEDHSSIANEPDDIDESGLTKQEQKAITDQTMLEFEKADIPTNLPTENNQLFTITNELYSKMSYYLNEVAAGNIKPNKEDIIKSLKIVLLHAERNDVSDASDVLNMIKSDQPDLFQDSLMELPQDQVDQIEKVLKIRDEEDDQDRQ